MRAMILAAGFGSRMRPLTDHCPKPLLPVAGKPLIVYHIEKLVAKGITDIVINHAYLGHMIEAALGDGSQFGCQIHYSAEESALETGGGIFKALPLLRESSVASDHDEPFLLVNGDAWLEWDNINIPNAVPGLGYLWLVENPEHNPEGDFTFTSEGQDHADHTLNDGASRIVDKKIGSGQAYTFSGISLLTPSLFNDSKPGAFPLAPLLREAMLKGQIHGELYHGQWVDVGTPERLKQVELLIRNQGIEE